MAVSVRKPVLYAFGVVLCAGIIGGIWLWYRTHCVLITNDSRIEGTLVGVASRLSDRVVQVMVNEGDTVHKGQGLVRIDSRSVMARKAKAEAALEGARWRMPRPGSAAGDHGGRPIWIRRRPCWSGRGATSGAWSSLPATTAG